MNKEDRDKIVSGLRENLENEYRKNNPLPPFTDNSFPYYKKYDTTGNIDGLEKFIKETEQKIKEIKYKQLVILKMVMEFTTTGFIYNLFSSQEEEWKIIPFNSVKKLMEEHRWKIIEEADTYIMFETSFELPIISKVTQEDGPRPAVPGAPGLSSVHSVLKDAERESLKSLKDLLRIKKY
jgi:hypothetical protein